jgi:hypothetical protein
MGDEQEIGKDFEEIGPDLIEGVESVITSTITWEILVTLPLTLINLALLVK